MNNTKTIRVKFILKRDDEEAIWKFINDSLRNKASKIKASQTSKKSDGREDVRITFEYEVITMISIERTKKLPEQTIKAHLIDLSLGGAALAIAPDQVVVPNSHGIINLGFLRPSRNIKIAVLA
ncbi:MAG: PilZ domain-containing protein [Oligoflexales bacterium]|nr:PilZ domain-containing protein [Oligoflexales bacterium]